MTAITPGIYPASVIPMARYLADPCPVPSLSSGACHTLLTQSPAHVYADHPRLGGRQSDDSNASDMGTLAHDLLLGGEGKICVIDPADYPAANGNIPDGWTNKAIRAARDEARQNGLTPVLAGAMGGARNMVKAAREFLASSELAGVLDSGESECTLIYEDAGTWFRARPDWLNRDRRVMLHLKTTQASANPAPFTRLATNAGYDVSLAYYRRIWEAMTGQQDWLHVILAQEQALPYACSLIGLDPAAWAIADEKVERAIRMWKRCMASGKWPAYSGQIHYATPTAWQLAEAERLAQESEA